MFAPSAAELAILALLALAPLLLIGLVIGLVTHGGAGGGSAAATSAIGHARAASVLSLAAFWLTVGLLEIVGLLTDRGWLGSLSALGGTLVALASLWLGERWSTRADGARRSAVLSPRRTRTMLARGWLRAWVVAAVLLTLAPPMLTRATGSPAWSRLVAELATLLVVATCWAGVVRVAVLRPATPDVDPELDLALRRQTVARASRIAVTGTVLTLGGTLFTAGAAAVSRQPDSVLSVLAIVVGMVALVVGVLTPFLPALRLPRPAWTPAHPTISV